MGLERRFVRSQHLVVARVDFPNTRPSLGLGHKLILLRLSTVQPLRTDNGISTLQELIYYLESPFLY